MGFQFGHFEILTDEHGNAVKLGEGGMGVTYKAWDKNLKLHAVVKVIHHKLVSDGNVRKRFFNEARAAARIDHPHVAKVRFCSDEDDAVEHGCFFAMEFINGDTLYSRIQRQGPMPAGEVLLLLRGIADALIALGDSGFIHRDIKPQNIMIEHRQRGQRAKLIDFGLVKALDEEEPDLHQSLSGGGFLGSVYFASPEQVKYKKGDQLDARTDFYSLGATLWHSLSGVPPFVGSQLEIMTGHAYQEPPWNKLVGVPEPALKLLRRLLAKRLEDRPQNAEELVSEWDAVLEQLSSANLAGSSSPSERETGIVSSETPQPAGDLATIRHRMDRGQTPPPVPSIPMEEEAPASPEPSNPAIGKDEDEGHDEELFAVVPSEIPGCMLPPGPGRLAHNRNGDWIVVRTFPRGCPEHLHMQVFAMAKRSMEWRHSGLLNVVRARKDEIRSEWQSGISVDGLLRVQRGAVPLSLILGWLPALGHTVDWAAAHGLSKTGMSPAHWLISFTEEPGSNPTQLAARPLSEWGPHQIFLDPLAGFSADLARAGAVNLDVTDPGFHSPALETTMQWLASFARVIYEIGGGPMGKFAPIASFGEDRNRLIAQAIDGTHTFSTISEWVTAFVALPITPVSRSSDASVRMERPAGTPAQDSKAAKARPEPEPAQSHLFDEGALGKTVEVKLPGSAVLTLCYCPPGSFTMGSPRFETGRETNEGPVPVQLSKGFWLAHTPMTQRQWEAIMGNNPSDFKGDNLPVESVSWDDAKACIEKLNATVPLPQEWQFALPNEAQWEYACRAGTSTPFSFGERLNGVEANCDGTFPYGMRAKGPHISNSAEVGKYPANAWGLYDMHGNVWEWCADWYEDELKGGLDPAGPKNGIMRVIRGGSWYDIPKDCRAATRNKVDPGCCSLYLGFRVAVVPKEGSALR